MSVLIKGMDMPSSCQPCKLKRVGDALKCKFCGGNINAESGICPFCDTQYKIEKPTPKAVLYADNKIIKEFY